ncbi:MAG: NifB/NifX family molybdenum-iron cluster-binding protein [Candidatus Bathyarchaeota archaeon]|nr:NifB/NifX family molybdenum-iron cluster-binding protein [Candidatus Bathyarchaeota archaeon]MDH5495653.1 NifB/NifX family molybdenum-iron cluster-binding protein [Candidatus Bathyarchaeota archaeon]
MKKKFRIAVATNGKKRLEDNVSEVFGRANTFTMVEIEDGKIQVSKVIENPALSYEHGAGPIAVKELVDSKVDLVIAPQLGIGASSILEHHDVTIILAKAGTKVAEAVEDALEESRKK